MTGFKYTNSSSGELGDFTFTGLGSDGFVACPSLNGSSPYQIFADFPGLCDEDVPGGNASLCLGFDALGVTYPGREAAWEYE